MRIARAQYLQHQFQFLNGAIKIFYFVQPFWVEVYFNSLMVRLKLVNLIQSKSGISHFNSLMVRLKSSPASGGG